jgi:hypothetical protein
MTTGGGGRERSLAESLAASVACGALSGVCYWLRWAGGAGEAGGKGGGEVLTVNKGERSGMLRSASGDDGAGRSGLLQVLVVYISIHICQPFTQ